MYFKSSPPAICYKIICVSSVYVYWYGFRYREYRTVPARYVPVSSKDIQRHCSRDAYGTNELGRRRASATTYHAGKLGRGWLHFKLWQMTGVWFHLAAGTTTAERFGYVAEGTTKAWWYRASGGRVWGVVLKQQLYWNGQGCNTMLDNIGQGGTCIYLFTVPWKTLKTPKGGIIWNPWMQMDDGIPKMKI